MKDRHNLLSYLATLGGIVLLCLCGAAVCIFAKADTEVAIGRIIGALSFISAGVTGLIGVIGTFKASAGSTTTQNIQEAGTVNASKPEGGEK